MSRHQIDYESLAQEAMRGLVRTVLHRVAKSGLPGDHHFYISFHTHGPGVIVSKRLLERYPDEMTIVLQNKFSDLKAFEERFEVTLWFDSIPERLSVPFAAIKVFFDPSVPFGHQFEMTDAAGRASGQSIGPQSVGERDAAPRPPAERPGPMTSVTTSQAPRSRQGNQGAKAGDRSGETARPVGKPPVAVPLKSAPPVPAASPATPRPAAANASVRPAEAAERQPAGKEPPLLPAKGKAPATPATAGTDDTASETPAASPAASKVVALDAFRKKS